MHLSNSQEIEMRKIAFCLRGEIDKTILQKKPRKKFAEDGRLNAYGAGANGQLFLQQLHFPLLLPSILLLPDCPPSICPFSLGQHFAFARGVSRPLYVSETVRPRPMGNPARNRKRGALWGTMAHYGEMIAVCLAERHAQGTMQGMKQGKNFLSPRM